ncbi:hypothetical protein GC102_17065 [Paenibacillus sp. LMG 31460]|uniref:Resolvase/invertase-type recombinase catalytic domain-containing protein n=1 Tax=Paenibacillus germinis TaxID=2654979 RepID=A0ABX1Z253_9BACL|nr:hypothetical protein [Paenibacillus germinis]
MSVGYVRWTEGRNTREYIRLLAEKMKIWQLLKPENRMLNFWQGCFPNVNLSEPKGSFFIS